MALFPGLTDLWTARRQLAPPAPLAWTGRLGFRTRFAALRRGPLPRAGLGRGPHDVNKGVWGARRKRFTPHDIGARESPRALQIAMLVAPLGLSASTPVETGGVIRFAMRGRVSRRKPLRSDDLRRDGWAGRQCSGAHPGPGNGIARQALKWSVARADADYEEAAQVEGAAGSWWRQARIASGGVPLRVPP